MSAPATGYRIRRVATLVISAVLMLWAAVTLAFVAVRLAPGDPIDALTGESADPALRARVAKDWGLDRPIYEQYGDYLWHLLRGDLGRSYVRGETVGHIVFGPELASTAKLAGFSLVLAVVIAIGVALLTAGRRGILARATSLAEVVLASAPAFWIGLVLISVFAFGLRVLPVTSGSELQRLILPGLTLALPIASVLSQVLREGIERSLEQPYALTARSRGTYGIRLRTRHGLRHSLIPAAALAGWAVSGLLTGTVVVEEVFGRSGLGKATVDAVTYTDLPVVLGVAQLAAAVYIGVTMLVDIAYLWIDPRLQEGTRA